MLLCAEQACAIAGNNVMHRSLEEAWWKLLYVQFHDILTGSHPTAVYNEAMETLDSVQAQAGNTVLQLLPVKNAESQRRTYALWNNLPWRRKERIRINIPDAWPNCCVNSSSIDISDVYLEGDGIYFLADIPPMCSGTVVLCKNANI